MAGNGKRLAEVRLKIRKCLRRRRTKELDFLKAAARGHQAFGKPMLAVVLLNQFVV
jgi:hypothetical protein